jgi:SAM-dependent MidA family methyltransferase
VALKAFLKTFKDYLPSELHQGQVYEWSPESGHLLLAILSVISQRQGLFLAIDYSASSSAPIVEQSFRGIRNHAFVHPLSRPGECDLTADVDFAELTRLRDRYNGFETLDTIEQGKFLNMMGSDLRISNLLKNCHSSEKVRSLISSYKRLVDTDSKSMGGIYKFWAARTKDTSMVLPSYPFQEIK